MGLIRGSEAASFCMRQHVAFTRSDNADHPLPEGEGRNLDGESTCQSEGEWQINM